MAMIPIGEKAYYVASVCSWWPSATEQLDKVWRKVVKEFTVLGHGKDCYFYQTGTMYGDDTPLIEIMDENFVFNTEAAALKYMEGMNEYEAME